MQVSNSETNSNLPENSEKILSLALDLGKSMVQCGAEINRVEETVRHICSAYGIQYAYRGREYPLRKMAGTRQPPVQSFRLFLPRCRLPRRKSFGRA